MADAIKTRFSTEPYVPVSVTTGDVTKTVQSERNKTDINVIMSKYVKTGVLNHQNPTPARYGDFSGFEDYLDCFSKVHNGEAAFADLPSQVRDHVGNDLGEYLKMITDPERRNELVELGLVEKPPAPPPGPPSPAPDPGPREGQPTAPEAPPEAPTSPPAQPAT